MTNEPSFNELRKRSDTLIIQRHIITTIISISRSVFMYGIIVYTKTRHLQTLVRFGYDKKIDFVRLKYGRRVGHLKALCTRLVQHAILLSCVLLT